MVIDYIDKLGTEDIDNLHALNYMKVGLLTLASNMSTYEKDFKERNNWCVFSIWWNDYTEENTKICLYMWFTNTLVNYVQLVWTLAIMREKGLKIQDIKENIDDIKKYSKSYTKKIIPDILEWRNKVFAHFSFTDPKSRDNLWLLQHSVANPLSWNWDNFVVWQFKWWEWEEVCNLPEWSLIKKYEELIPRYWPEITINR